MSTLSMRQDLGCFPRGEAKFEVPEVKAEFWEGLFSGEVLATVGTFRTDVAL